MAIDTSRSHSHRSAAARRARRQAPLAFTPSALALWLGLALLPACSGGSAGGPSLGSRQCADITGASGAFCLVSCNLGCTNTGCAVTDIPQNQPIFLTFSQPVDPSSVDSGTVILKTATGKEPVGSYVVAGATVAFVPSVQIQGGVSFFGFTSGETYLLTVPTEGVRLLRSTSGDTLARPVSCSLRVGNIRDLDGLPPTAKLLLPDRQQNVSRTPNIVVEFSELLDSAPFQFVSRRDAPMEFLVRRTTEVGGRLECVVGPGASSIPGTMSLSHDPVRQVSIVRFSPAVELPGAACVEVAVTSRVKDISGTPAAPQVFQFTTEPAATIERRIIESFPDATQLDDTVSAGRWGAGRLVPTQLGGDGLHGAFDLSLVTDLGNQEYEWDMERDTKGSQKGFLIPAGSNPPRTLTGVDEFVADARFRFSSFVLPRGVTLYVKSSKPPRIQVRGRCDIGGRIVLRGADAGTHSSSMGATGQVGAAGGPGGAKGGDGADRGDGVQNRPQFNGQDGSDVLLPAGHAYGGQQVGTGGKGSPQWPTSGRNADIAYRYITISGQIGGGGGGGGFETAGAAGAALRSISLMAIDLGPGGEGGKAFSLLPLPTGADPYDHLLVGGSGGGGGGSHPYFSISNAPGHPRWISGCGGGGGGGAIGITVGRDLIMRAGSAIDVRGGRGGQNPAPDQLPPAGGGGSGGAIVLRVEVAPDMQGLLDAGGGEGGVSSQGPSTGGDTRGGKGGAGVIYLETDSPSAGMLGQTVPPAQPRNVGPVTADDDIVGVQSKWYQTNVLFAPTFVRYEVEAVVNGLPVVYSDDPSVGTLATPYVEPVGFMVQGGRLDEQGQIDPTTVQAWRRFVGTQSGGGTALNDDQVVALRFLILFNRQATANVEVRKVTIVYRT